MAKKFSPDELEKELKRQSREILKKDYYDRVTKGHDNLSSEQKKNIKNQINKNVDNGITNFTIEF